MAESLRSASKNPRAPKRNGPAPSGDNARAIEEAEQAQLLSVMFKLREQGVKVDAKKAELDVERQAMNSLLDMGAAQGFPKKLLRELLKDVAVTGQRRNIRAEEVQRAKCRNWLGLPVGDAGEQSKLDLMPEEARDELDWRGEGYTAYFRNSKASPPDDCPPRFHQAWLTGFNEGQSAVILSMRTVETVVPEPDTESDEDENEPEGTIGDERFDEAKEARRMREALDNIGVRDGDEIVDSDPLGVGQEEAEPV